MAQLNGLPVYSISFKDDLDDKTGIDFVSLVDYPAIETNWVAMSKESTKAPLNFKFDADKQILYGPILIPDLPIYRYNEKTKEEFYVVFPKDVVERLVRKFQKQAKTINLNYQHQKNSQVAEAVIQEIWLTGNPDKSNAFGFELPEGSGFVGAHIGDSKFWSEEIKSGNVKGFSIEGFLDMEMKKILNQYNMTEKFITAKTDKGVEVKSDGETFAVGAEVYTEVDGVRTPITEDVVLENGTTLKIADGKISEVVEKIEDELDKEQVEVIQKAVKPMVEQMFADLKKSYETKIAELEAKLNATPGAPSKTEKTDKPSEFKTQKQRLEAKLSILRKKSQEITK